MDRCERDKTYNAVRRALPEQWMTVGKIRQAIASAEGDYVQITCYRSKAPARGKQVRLIIRHKGRQRNGPKSIVDRRIEHAGGSMWSAWWFIPDLERWLRSLDREDRRA